MRRSKCAQKSDNISVKCKQLETEVFNISQEIAKNTKIIQSIQKVSENSITNKDGTHSTEAIMDDWHTEKSNRYRYDNDSSKHTFTMPLDNRFNGLPIDEEVFITDGH